MVKPEIIKETALTMSELRDEIEKIKKKSEKLNFRAEKTEEYLNQFAILDSKKSAELKEKLEKMNIPRLKEEHITKIVDLLPTSAEDIKSILHGYTITITNDNLKKIAECVKDFKK
jgi:DNA-directed RNA polymerase subunit F